MTATEVWVSTTFIGFHRWKDAPDALDYLRDYHRHEFHVKVFVPVSHDDRDVEFHTLKYRLCVYLRVFEGGKFDHSCEQLAKMILEDFGANSVVVSEDGENGAVVTRGEFV